MMCHNFIRIVIIWLYASLIGAAVASHFRRKTRKFKCLKLIFESQLRETLQILGTRVHFEHRVQIYPIVKGK